MERNPLDESPTSQPDATPSKSAAEQGPPPAETRRKPYASPMLTEHGRVPVLTFAAPSVVVKSDRHAKGQFEAIDAGVILTAVATLPIERWSYKGEPARHLGPMAQDFAAAFGLGPDDRHIFPLDAAGVALAAIQGLHGLVQAQAARLDALDREVAALRGETAALRLELAVREHEPVA